MIHAMLDGNVVNVGVSVALQPGDESAPGLD
jgi:hypothetical protein